MVSVNIILQTLTFMMIESGYFANTLFKTFDNYGPYTVLYTRLDSCAGPKTRNLTNYSIDIVKEEEDYVAYFNFTYLESCHIDMIKLKSLVVEKHQKKILLNYVVNDPCQHFLIASILEMVFKSNKCTVQKGEYLGKLNMSNITRSFYGRSAFYGEYENKVVATTKKGNTIILCFVSNTIIKKI